MAPGRCCLMALHSREGHGGCDEWWKIDRRDGCIEQLSLETCKQSSCMVGMLSCPPEPGTRPGELRLGVRRYRVCPGTCQIAVALCHWGFVGRATAEDRDRDPITRWSGFCERSP